MVNVARMNDVEAAVAMHDRPARGVRGATEFDQLLKRAYLAKWAHARDFSRTLSAVGVAGHECVTSGYPFGSDFFRRFTMSSPFICRAPSCLCLTASGIE